MENHHVVYLFCSNRDGSGNIKKDKRDLAGGESSCEREKRPGKQFAVLYRTKNDLRRNGCLSDGKAGDQIEP